MDLQSHSFPTVGSGTFWQYRVGGATHTLPKYIYICIIGRGGGSSPTNLVCEICHLFKKQHKSKFLGGFLDLKTNCRTKQPVQKSFKQTKSCFTMIRLEKNFENHAFFE